MVLTASSLLTLAALPSGEFISAVKCIPPLILLALWGRLVTWIDKDAPQVLLPRQSINVGNVVGGALAFLLFFMLPAPIGLIALFAIIAIEAGVYLVMRN